MGKFIFETSLTAFSFYVSFTNSKYSYSESKNYHMHLFLYFTYEIQSNSKSEPFYFMVSFIKNLRTINFYLLKGWSCLQSDRWLLSDSCWFSSKFCCCQLYYTGQNVFGHFFCCFRIIFNFMFKHSELFLEVHVWTNLYFLFMRFYPFSRYFVFGEI